MKIFIFLIQCLFISLIKTLHIKLKSFKSKTLILKMLILIIILLVYKMIKITFFSYLLTIIKIQYNQNYKLINKLNYYLLRMELLFRIKTI